MMKTQGFKRRRFVRMFQERFAEAVRLAEKRQTLRPVPKRRPVARDVIDCRRWEGAPYRSKQVKLREEVLQRVRLVTLGPGYLHFFDAALPLTEEGREEFARKDGFMNWAELEDWFDAQYGIRRMALPIVALLLEW